MQFDSESNRFYIKKKPGNKTKIYINDARTKWKFKVSNTYLDVLRDVFKNGGSKNIFNYLNDDIVKDPRVGTLLRKYKVTETDKFEKLYKASINFIKSWKSKMIFTVNDVKKALNTSVFEANLTPYKMPEHDSPLDLVNDYLKAGIRNYLKFLREKGYKHPRGFNYIIEIHNNEDPNRTRVFTVSRTFQNWGNKTIESIKDAIETFIVSSNLQNLNNLSLRIKSYPNVSGGAISQSLNEAIYNKTSIIKMTNTGNECFWWCLVLLMNQKTAVYSKLADLRYSTTLNQMAKSLCESCGFDYSEKVKLESIPTIIKSICEASRIELFNIIVLDIENLPAFATTTTIKHSIYFNAKFKSDTHYYLLLDNNHFSPILDIKKFLNVRAFCNKCLKAFNVRSTFDSHVCEEIEESDNDVEVKYSDIASRPIASILRNKLRKDRRLFLNKRIKPPKAGRNTRYIIWDTETTQEPDENGHRIHVPNLIVAFEIIVPHKTIKQVEQFVDNLKPHVFKGADCVGDYCSWVMAEESNLSQRRKAREYNKTVCIAHNSRGYDSRFILQYLDSKSIMPQTIRANNGSSIQFIGIKQGSIVWIDSLNFFNEPLASLPKTYGIKNTVKGYFPHGFNSPQNQDYEGVIPDIKYYHPEYIKIINGKGKLDFTAHEELNKWWQEQKNNNVIFKMKDELLKYCIDDCKVLLKAVLIFRNVIMDKEIKIKKDNGTFEEKRLNIDPWLEAITIPSLAQKIYRNNFLPDGTIESFTDTKKRQSAISGYWIHHLIQTQSLKLSREFHLNIKFSSKARTLSVKVFKDTLTVKVPENVEFKYYLKNGYCNFDIDAFDVKSLTLYEFYGDRWHGNPRVKHRNKEEAELYYKMTMEREMILKLLGFKLITIWEDDWKNEMENFTLEYRKSLIESVNNGFINTREALHGGRTEVFKTFYECKSPGEFIFSFDISSQYPAVMALDNYAVGVNCSINYNIDKLTKDILNDRFTGLVKCDVCCPKDEYVPVLPTNDPSSGRLVFTLEDKQRVVYTSTELKYALECGYKITKLYGVDSYLRRKGLFKEYVEFFYKMKIENTRFYTPEECEEINHGFKNKGLDIEIESKNTCSNSGLRGVAKLFLNSLWGKFGQRPVFTEYACVRSLREMAKYTTDENINVVNIHIIHENLVEIHYERNKDASDAPDYVSPITAAFTTSNARVRLAKFLKVLHPTQLLYCDTDSCYFVYNPNNSFHVDPRTATLPEGVEIGDGLGQWEIEMSDGKKFAGIGAKCYAGECVDVKNNCLKIKGVTIDYKNKDKITFEAMAKVAKSINAIPVEQQRSLLSKDKLIKSNGVYIQTNPRFRFQYDKLNKKIQTCDIDKIVQNTVGLKRFVENNVSYPYGYEGNKYIID